MNQITILKAKRIIKDVFKDHLDKLEYNDTAYTVTYHTGIDPDTVVGKDNKQHIHPVWFTQITFTYKQFLYKHTNYFYDIIRDRKNLAYEPQDT